MTNVVIYYTLSGEPSASLLVRAASLCTNRPPEQISIRRESGKKPVFLSPFPLYASVSHSGGVWAAAFSDVLPVGLDLQKTVSVRRMDGILTRYFHPAEREAVLAASPEARDAAFCRMWSRKEAAAKLSGRGIDGGFSSFDASASPTDVFGETLFIRDFALPGFPELAAAAVFPAEFEITLIPF